MWGRKELGIHNNGVDNSIHVVFINQNINTNSSTIL